MKAVVVGLLLLAGMAFADERSSCITGALKLGFSEPMSEKLCNRAPSPNAVNCAQAALALEYDYRGALQICWQGATEHTGKCLADALALEFYPVGARQLCGINATPERAACARGILEAGGRHMFAIKTCNAAWELTNEYPE